MPPSDQERRCADAICGSLNEATHQAWTVARWLDDEYPNESSPDVQLTDGNETIAIEIKRLTDGRIFHRHDRHVQSLHRRLAPDRDRSYFLILAPTARLPFPGAWLPRIKKAIADSASGLQVGEEIVIRLPRHSKLKYYFDSEPRVVECQHADDGRVHMVSPEAAGYFGLEDSDEPGHQFLSEELRAAFERELGRACDASMRDGQADVNWQEEWTLRRLPDPPAGSGGVHVQAATADFLESAAIESVTTAIDDAKKKFVSMRWADRAAVALHAGEQQSELALSAFKTAIGRLTVADVHPLDTVFLVHGSQVAAYRLVSREE